MNKFSKIILIIIYANVLVSIYHVSNYNPYNDDLFYIISIYLGGMYAIFGASLFLMIVLIKLWKFGVELLTEKIEKIVDQKNKNEEMK